MKRIFVALVFFGLWIGLNSVPAAAQDNAAQESAAQKIEEGKKILAKLIDVMGGRDRLLKIEDTKATCNINIIPVNMSGSLVLSEKKNKIRQDIQIMGMNIIQAYNGETGWMTDPQTGSIVDMPEPVLNEFKREGLGNDALLEPEKHGITFTSEGRKNVEGKEYHLLKMTYKDGSESTMYIDPDTFLLYRTVGMTLNQTLQKVEQETTLFDYRDVDGTKVPFSIKIKQGGMDYLDLTVTEVKYNSNIDDSIFDKPAGN